MYRIIAVKSDETLKVIKKKAIQEYDSFDTSNTRCSACIIR